MPADPQDRLKYDHAEKAMAIAKEEWEQTFDAVPDLIAILDNQHRIVRVNKAMANRLGVTKEEAAGLTCYEHVHGTDEPPEFCPHSRLLADGQEHTVEIHEDRLGGDFLVSVSPLHDDEGQLIGSVHVARDITKRKRAEAALEESEERFRKISATAHDAIIMMDNDGNITYWNPASEKIFGYMNQEILGKKLKVIIPERYRKAHRKGFERFKNTGQGKAIGKRLELSAIKKSGTEFPIELSLSAVKIRDKWNAIGLVRDVSKRKRAEEKIKRDFHIQSTINSILKISLEPISLDEQLERILDLILSIPWLSVQSKGCIFLVEDDPDMLAMKAQRRLSDTLITSCAKVPFGKCLCGRAASTGKMVFTDHIDDHHETHYEGMLPHGHYNIPILSGDHVLGVICMYVKEGHKKDKKEEEFLTSVANTMTGIIERKRAEEELKKAKDELELRVKERTYELAMTVDLLEQEIAERKKTEGKLAREHKLIQTLMDHAPDSIYFKDEKSRFVKVSKSKAKHRATTPENMIGKTDFDFLPIDQGRKAFSDDMKVMKSGKPIKDRVEKITRKNGTEVWVSATKIPWFDEKDKIVGTIGISRNITERMKAEEALNNEREKFISVLIHDLRGPLVSALGFTKRIIAGKAKSEEDRMRILKIIQEDSQDLLKIIENTSNDLRNKSGLQSFHPEDVDFLEILTSAITNFTPEIEEKGIKLFVNNKENWNTLDKIILKGDPYQLKALMENLLGNAIKYAKSTIEIELQKSDDYIHFIISDDGPGIPEKYLGKIFDEYFQVPGSKKGTGLGLYSAKKVVENHRGKICVHSFPDMGTSFEITFPC